MTSGLDTIAAYARLTTALSSRYGPSEAAGIARIVLEDAFHWRRPRPDRLLSIEEITLFEHIEKRLLAGEPLQYVLGQADFYGLKFNVSPAVLIPRAETEELVAWIIDSYRSLDRRGRVARLLDIGTGSGCIPITLKRHLPRAEVFALDVSEAALAVARENAELLNTSITFAQADILQATTWPAWPPFDVIVSNPPYIPWREAGLMPDWVHDHEPALALFVADDDPLLFYRHILAYAQTHLRPGGRLFFECNEFNAREISDLATPLGFTDIELRRDMQGKERMWRGSVRLSGS